ncbi:MAG: putative spermidine/putrescine transport system permease protein [Nocardioidaceae bacterium]|jgi:putative spermidine/putrescine transport system permease protein|nr:putative spermidine/putrescine transport system permease protein [Nocardioidaceae bacterium]
MRTSVRARVVRGLLLLLFALYFLIPLYSMLDFSTRGVPDGRSGDAWAQLVQDPTLSSGIVTSLVLALLTVAGMLVLLVPTMIWVRLRVPWATRVVEFLCLLPLTIPALVIVVGMRNVYGWVNYLISDSVYTLTFVYVVLVLPYAYRAIDNSLAAIDVVTLSEAARSLGAGWPTVITRIVVPNIGAGLLSASFVSVALVIGEYVIASLTHYDTLQVVIALLGKSEARTSVAASLASLVFVSVLLLLLSYVGRGRRRRERRAS